MDKVQEILTDLAAAFVFGLLMMFVVIAIAAIFGIAAHVTWFGVATCWFMGYLAVKESGNGSR